MMLKNLGLLFLVGYILFSCKSPRFAKGGVFVEDVDRYFNTSLKNANVWLYMDIKPFHQGETGLKTNQLYPYDKKILQSVGIERKGTKILFSAVPDSKPQYHLIAIHHHNPIKKLNDYEKKIHGEAYYFQKDLEQGRLDIRHIYIPYKKGGGLSLVYYISTEEHLHCRFCKLDYLARINAMELQINRVENLSWQISECRDGEQKKDVDLMMDTHLENDQQIASVKVYLDFLNGNTGLQYFQIVRPTERPNIGLQLCPGKYYVEYQDSEFHVIQRDTVSVGN